MDRRPQRNNEHLNAAPEGSLQDDGSGLENSEDDDSDISQVETVIEVSPCPTVVAALRVNEEIQCWTHILLYKIRQTTDGAALVVLEQ